MAKKTAKKKVVKKVTKKKVAKKRCGQAAGASRSRGDDQADHGRALWNRELVPRAARDPAAPASRHDDHVVRADGTEFRGWRAPGSRLRVPAPASRRWRRGAGLRLPPSSARGLRRA